MRVAVTNLAWPPGEDDEAAAILGAGGIGAVELALTRYWTDPAQAPANEVAEVRGAWTGRNIDVVALQSLLFGQPQLRLFDEDVRQPLLERLVSIGHVAARLGAPVMVFGSPKQRQRGPLSEEEALRWAAAFFGDVAEALPEEVTLGIESNPKHYGCDFLTTPNQVHAFIKALDHPRVRLHLDLACAHLAGEDPVAAARSLGATAAHVHASEPELEPLRPPSVVDHFAAGAALRSSGYPHVVCAEVLAGPDWGSALSDTVETLVRSYG